MIKILYETENFLVVNKPPGLLSIPGKNPREPNLLKDIARQFPKQRFLVVHRIDRDTSGVILFARNEEAHRVANSWFMTHVVKKEYLALASGSPRTPAIRVSRPIEGKPSLSQIQVLERFHSGDESAFLARVRIATGRRHQIRIHLSEEGFPILGDTYYGGPKIAFGFGLPRFALHAERLVLPASEYGDSVEIAAELPEDFNDWLRRLRNATNSEASS